MPFLRRENGEQRGQCIDAVFGFGAIEFAKPGHILEFIVSHSLSTIANVR